MSTDEAAGTATPLQLIERAVLDRAKEIRLDLDDDEARARLRALVEEQVSRWSTDFRRGLRSHDLADPELVTERAYRNLVGYGPLESLLADDDVWEVMINAPDSIFVKRHEGPSGYHDEVFHDDEHVVRTLTKVLDDASGASSIRPRASRTHSSTTALDCTSSTATCPAAATSW